MLNLKNALRCVTANLKVGSNVVVGGLVLVICGLLVAPHSAYASSHCERPTTTWYNASGPQSTGNNSACAKGIFGVAIGHKTLASGGTGSTAVGSRSLASHNGTSAFGVDSRATGANGTAIGFASDVAGHYATAVGYFAIAAHENASAFGTEANTTRANQMVFGTVKRVAALTRADNSEYAQKFEETTAHYRFAGLALSEDDITQAGFVNQDDDLSVIGFSHQDVRDRQAIIDNYRDTHRNRNRMLRVNGHGDLEAVSVDEVNIGMASQDASGSGTIYERLASLRANGGGERYDDTAVVNRITATETAIGSYSDSASDAASASLHARINKNRADIASFQSAGVSSETMAQIDGNTAQGQKNAQGVEKNSQGVALSNALASLPKALLPGERLRLGIGVGSFDGKSGTAIGIMGKFGASTLLNAGFSTGGGESSTQVGISWGW